MTAIDPSIRDTVGEYKWGFHDTEKPLFMAEKGLNPTAVSYTHLTLPTICSV